MLREDVLCQKEHKEYLQVDWWTVQFYWKHQVFGRLLHRKRLRPTQNLKVWMRLGWLQLDFLRKSATLKWFEIVMTILLYIRYLSNHYNRHIIQCQILLANIRFKWSELCLKEIRTTTVLYLKCRFFVIDVVYCF